MLILWAIIITKKLNEIGQTRDNKYKKMYKGMVVTGEVYGKSVKNIDSNCFKIVQFVIKSYIVQ